MASKSEIISMHETLSPAAEGRGRIEAQLYQTNSDGVTSDGLRGIFRGSSMFRSGIS